MHLFHFPVLYFSMPLSFYGSGWGIPPSRALPSAPIDSCFRLSAKGSGRGFRSSSQNPPSPPICSVGFLVNLGSYELGLVVQWRLRILSGCLSRHLLRSGMASESLNEVRFILSRRHRVPEQGDKYIGQGQCSPQSPPLPWNHPSHLVAM